ncbi:MAG: DUF5693 family protein, partial [Armatimonadetes bacterium]|nr:DUF5693 family protein [Armatimonadota bacterium]
SLVRVHSIPSSEMAEMNLQEAVDRFVRAVKERNIRLCYIHLAETTGEDPIGRNTEFITAISTRIRSLGYTTGLSKPFEQLFRPKLMLVLMALSVVAGAVLALSRLISVSWLPRLVLVALGMLASVAILQMFGEIGKQLLAFAAALIYPVLSTVVLVVPLFNAELDYNLPELKAIGTLMAMSLISMCGGLLIVGFLADRAYMVKQSQFIGVRGAHVVPMIAVALLAISGLPILGKSVRAVWCDVKSTAAVVASRPLTLGQALVLIAVFAIVGLAVVRTTNEPAIDPFSAELRSRAILETALVVRPRAKEFLIGHPALLLGIALLATRRRDWALPLVVLGMLGQVSLVNSFCHIHTPLTVSISRTANGLVLGIIVGLVLWASFFERGLPSKQSLHRP